MRPTDGQGGPLRAIGDVAAELGLRPEEWADWGPGVAKVHPEVAKGAPDAGRGRLVLVSAITPTPAGEGKTTTSIGLAQALARLGYRSCAALREPSLGPSLGMKGGGTGGGRSRLQPRDRIELHFTGDFHAVTSAHNLLAALLDNHLHFARDPVPDPRRVLWPRVVDLNDRSLRRLVLGLGGPAHGVPREGGFEITAASEVMAMLCLAEDAADLRRRIDRTLVAYTRRREPIRAGELGATGAMLALLRDALWPNLVQTTEGTPALVHGGPFANIAHGCSSLIATRTALARADWVITEAGFGFDLGAEKFFDIKCHVGGLDTAAVVLVATCRALKHHGGVALADVARPDPGAVERGLANLEKHVENIRIFGERPVVALNRFDTDAAEEIAVVGRHCEALGVPFAVADPFGGGGEGTLDLAREVVEHAERSDRPFRPLYELGTTPEEKIRRVARAMYGARDVALTREAREDLREVARLGHGDLPVCIAKVAGSLSDDPSLLGRPRDFDLTVRGVRIAAGAGFLVVLTGDILRMPGLPREPLAERLDLAPDGSVVGLA